LKGPYKIKDEFSGLLNLNCASFIELLATWYRQV